MKKLLLLLFIFPLFVACSDDDEDEPKQDYTSFTLTNNTTVDLRNVVIGYKTGENYIKVADLGNLNFKQTSKEVKIENKSIKELYVFADYLMSIKYEIVLNPQNNIKNVFSLPSGLKVYKVTDKNDPKQYPQ